MSLTSLLVFLAIGAIAGWLAGLLMRGGGYGLIGNIVIGVLGAFIGGMLFGRLALFPAGMLGVILSATLGAVVLIALLRLLRRA